LRIYFLFFVNFIFGNSITMFMNDGKYLSLTNTLYCFALTCDSQMVILALLN